jgi:psp operon transcriptional activator
LRARAGAVIVLAEHFGRRMASEIGWDEWPGFGPTALDALTNHRWPGNVRELRNVVERAIYRWEREGPVDRIEIDPFDSPYRPRSTRRVPPREEIADVPADQDEAPVTACDTGPSDFKSRVARFERELLSRALAENRFNQRSTADALGLSYDQLRHALRRHELTGSESS